MAERHKSEASFNTRIETEAFSTFNLDRIFNSLGIFPEVRDREEWQEIAKCASSIIKDVEKKYQAALNEARKHPYGDTYTIEKAMDKEIHIQIAESFCSRGWFNDSELPASIEERGDIYTYYYLGDDCIMGDDYRMIAPAQTLLTRAIHREEMRKAENLVAEAVHRLKILTGIVIEPGIHWHVLCRHHYSDFAKKSSNPLKSAPKKQIINAANSYAYPWEGYYGYKREDTSLYPPRADRLDPFIYLAKYTLLLDVDVPCLSSRTKFGDVTRKEALDPVQDFLYRVALAFELRAAKKAVISPEERAWIQKKFNPDADTSLLTPIEYRRELNPFTPLLEILATGVYPVGLDTEGRYGLTVKAEKWQPDSE